MSSGKKVDMAPANSTDKTLKAWTWAGYVGMVSSSIEQAQRVMKFGGLAQPDVAKHLQSSRASFAVRGDL